MSEFITVRYSKSGRDVTFRKDKVVVYTACKDYPNSFTRVWVEGTVEIPYNIDMTYQDFHKLMQGEVNTNELR